METLNNDIIKQKINSINSLPNNYEPNLDSKWELMEASLRPHKRKPFLFVFDRIASIAAILLLLGGISIYGIKTIKRPKQINSIILAQNVGKPIENNKNLIEKQSVEVKSKKAKTTRILTNIESPKAELPLVMVHNNAINTKILDTNELLVIEIPKKQKRFTEIDFGEPILSEQNGIAIQNNPNLKFKIGDFNQANVATFAQNKPNYLGISKQIN